MQAFATIFAISVILTLILSSLWWIYKTQFRSHHRISNHYEDPVHLLVFTRPSCKTYKRKQLPIIQQLKKELGDALWVEEVDPTFQPELAEQYRVMTMPTSFIFDGHGDLQVSNRGVVPFETLRNQLHRAVTS